jgi:hypothetical protein
MRIIFTMIFSISLLQLFGQSCDSFNRDLFHMLPSEFPDTVNCVDENGHKQGWWLIYKVKYNPIDKPDELEKGDYVERYSYGKYQNNRKVETWKVVENVHLIYECRIDNFFYSKDSTLIKSTYADGGWNETTTFFNSDSTEIKYSHVLPKVEYPLIITCDKKLPNDQQCQTTYRENELKVFPFARFEIEKELLRIDYLRDIKLIDKGKE